MAIILKPLFEVLSGNVAICDNWLYNYIFLAFVGEVAYHFAYRAVGDLYNLGIISGRATGSIIHWTIRFPLYIVTAYLLRASIWIYNFVVSVPVQVWWALLAAILVVGLACFIVFRILHKDADRPL